MLLRAREERTQVELAACMTVGAGPIDVCVHNLSSRGLMASAAAAPPSRSYVEFRCGPHIVIGKVMWTRGPFFGVNSQDRIDVQAMIESIASKAPAEDARGKAKARGKAAGTPTLAELASMAQRSRDRGVVIQWIGVTGAGAVAACTMAALAYRVLATPLGQVAGLLNS